MLRYLRLAILSDLVRRDQIAGWELPRGLGEHGDDVRAVLAELVNPAFSFRTPEGIAKSIHLSLAFVADTLARLQQADPGKPVRIWQGTVSGQRVFALESRKPGWFTSLPVIRQIVWWWDKPTIG